MTYQVLQETLAFSITATQQYLVEGTRNQVRVQYDEDNDNKQHRDDSDNTAKRAAGAEWKPGLHDSPTNSNLLRLRCKTVTALAFLLLLR